MKPLPAILGCALAACGGSSTPASPDAAAGGPDAGAPAVDAGPPVFGELGPVRESSLPQPDLEPDWLEPGLTYHTVHHGRGVVEGDFDGDGLTDLVVSRTFFTSGPPLPVEIWVNQGDGTFADGTADVIAGEPLLVEAPMILTADFNDDGRLDVAFIDQGFEQMRDVTLFLGGRNRLLLSGPDGRLHDASAAIPVDYNGFNHVSSVGDPNDDGCPDLIISELGGIQVDHAGLYFLLGDCDGGFTKSTAGLPPEITERPTGELPPGVDVQGSGTNVVADLDGDDVPELVTASYGPDAITGDYTVRVLAQSGGDFAEASHVSAPAVVRDAVLPAVFGCAGLQAGDLDGDERAELIVLWEGLARTFIEVLHNDGGLAFSDVTLDVLGNYEMTLCLSGAAPPCDDRSPASWYRLRDVDADGDLDLVVGMTAMSADNLAARSFIYVNDGDGNLTPWVFHAAGAPASRADIVAAFAPRQDWQIGGIPLVFDATGDGVNDVVIVNTNHFRADPPRTTEVVYVYTVMASPP